MLLIQLITLPRQILFFRKTCVQMSFVFDLFSACLYSWPRYHDPNRSVVVELQNEGRFFNKQVLLLPYKNYNSFGRCNIWYWPSSFFKLIGHGADGVISKNCQIKCSIFIEKRTAETTIWWNVSINLQSVHFYGPSPEQMGIFMTLTSVSTIEKKRILQQLQQNHR